MPAKSLDSTIYEVSSSGSSTEPAFKTRSAREVGLRESWFRDAIYGNPDLVVGVCRRAGLVRDDEQWYSWAKEFPVDVGFIDVMLLSSHGRIGVVETKLSFNPERRREVVAQVLDYALALQEIEFDHLPQLHEAANRHDVEDALTSGRFLLVITGDEMEPRALRLGESLVAAHLTSEWDLAMIDLNLYANGSGTNHLIVPELRGMVVHETRQVVRVLVEGAQPNASIRVERLPDPSRSERTNWDRDRLFAAIATASSNPGLGALLNRLETIAAKYPGAELVFGSGKTGSMTLKRSGGSILSFFQDGRAEAKPRTQVNRALGSGADGYLAAVRRLWGPEFVDGWKRPTAEQVSMHGGEVLDALENALGLTESPPESV